MYLEAIISEVNKIEITWDHIKQTFIAKYYIGDKLELEDTGISITDALDNLDNSAYNKFELNP